MTEPDHDLERFAQRARAWFEEHGVPAGTAPHRSRETEAYVAAARAFQRGLFDAGLAGIRWPREYGGLGLDARYEQRFRRAARGYEVFDEIFWIGLGMCGPVLLGLGTEEQKQRFIRPMLAADELWCQLFSEPGAGSDLASLSTAAAGTGHGFLVNGQKVWNTYAHFSDLGLLLARTDPNAPRHRGITMFIADMKADGMVCRPLKQLTGDTEFNEVFLDDVQIPADRVVGMVDDGWRAATLMLMNERVTLGKEGTSIGGPVSVAAVAELARTRGLAADSAVRSRIAGLYALERSIKLFARGIARELQVGQDPGARASVGKLATSRLVKEVAALALEIAGPDATAWDPTDAEGDRWAHGVLYAPSLSIAGGTDQIQLTILGERVLGLPREPQQDKDTPFRELRRSS